MTDVTTFPLRGPMRFKALKDALRRADPDTLDAMRPTELVAMCERAAPGCTVPEIIAAMRQVSAERLREAEALELTRKR
jgi:hypothetical protein